MKYFKCAINRIPFKHDKTNDNFYLFCVSQLHVVICCIFTSSTEAKNGSRKQNTDTLKPNENDTQKNTRYFNHYINQIYSHTFFSRETQSDEKLM